MSQIYIKLDDPRNIDLVKKQLDAKYEGYPILFMKGSRILFIQWIIFRIPVFYRWCQVGYRAGLLIVGMSMYMAVLPADA